MRSLAMLILAACAAGSMWTAWAQAQVPRKTQYRELARDLMTKASPGEIVYVPENVTYWGVARYLVGPEWGSILKIQDPERPDFSEAWKKIYARLGTQKLQWLGLVPDARQIASPVGPLVIGWSPLPALQTAHSFWMVGNNEIDPLNFPICAHPQVVTTKYTGVQLHHVTCASS